MAWIHNFAHVLIKNTYSVGWSGYFLVKWKGWTTFVLALFSLGHLMSTRSCGSLGDWSFQLSSAGILRWYLTKVSIDSLVDYWLVNPWLVCSFSDLRVPKSLSLSCVHRYHAILKHGCLFVRFLMYMVLWNLLKITVSIEIRHKELWNEWR